MNKTETFVKRPYYHHPVWMRRSANALKATLQYLTGDDFFKATKVSRRFAKILCPPVVEWQQEFRIDENCDPQ